MSWQHFGFIVAFGFAALWAIAGLGPALGALLLGAVGFYVGRIVDGDVDVAELLDRFGTRGRTR